MKDFTNLGDIKCHPRMDAENDAIISSRIDGEMIARGVACALVTARTWFELTPISPAAPRGQRGLTMIDMVLVIAMTSVLVSGFWKGYGLWQKKTAERAAGRFMAEYNEAIGSYQATYFQGLIQSTPGIPYLKTGATPSSASVSNPTSYGNIPTGRTACYKPEDSTTPVGCTPVLYRCSDPSFSSNNALATTLPCLSDHLLAAPLVPWVADIKALRLVPAGFSETIAELQAQLVTSIRQVGFPSAPNLESLTITSVPWLKQVGDASGSNPATNAPGDALIARSASAARMNPKLGYTHPSAPLTALFPTAGGSAGNNAASLADFNLQNFAFPSGGLLVARNGYSSQEWAQYQRLDDTQARTGDLNFGGHQIYNLQQNQLNTACDGVNPQSAASAKLVGAMGTIKPTQPDPGNPSQMLGAGNIVTCVYDQATQGYYWKSALRPITAEDGDAGLSDGYETSPNWSCNAPAGYNVPGFAGLGIIKGVFKNGRVYGYWRMPNATWQMSPDQMAGTPFNTVNQVQNQFSTSSGWSALVYDQTLFNSTGGLGCIASGSNGAQLFASWSFNATGFTYQVTGAYMVTDNSTTIAAGIPVQVTVPVTSTVVTGIDPGTGNPIFGTSTSNQTVTGQTLAADHQVQTTHWQPVNQTFNYPIARRTLCVPPNPC